MSDALASRRNRKESLDPLGRGMMDRSRSLVMAGEAAAGAAADPRFHLDTFLFSFDGWEAQFDIGATFVTPVHMNIMD